MLCSCKCFWGSKPTHWKAFEPVGIPSRKAAVVGAFVANEKATDSSAWTGISCETAASLFKSGRLDLRGYTVMHAKHGVKSRLRNVGVVDELVDYGYQMQLKVVKPRSFRLATLVASPYAGLGSVEPNSSVLTLERSDHAAAQSSAQAERGRDSATTAPRETAKELHEEHLIPFVNALIASVLPEHKRIVVQLPNGLLALGRRKMYLRLLERELQPYLSSPANEPAVRVRGQLEMPSRSLLKAAGRSDLLNLIRLAGGVSEVAQELGLRSYRRPHGFWDDITNLDQELTLFIAAAWMRLEIQAPVLVESSASHERADAPPGLDDSNDGGDDGDHNDGTEYYYYNPVIQRTQFEAPEPPRLEEDPQDGSLTFIEDEGDRYMPSKRCILDARRWDLDSAIEAHGGYRHVRRQLQRKAVRRKLCTQLWQLRKRVRACQKALGLPSDALPTAGQFESLGRGYLVRSVVALGGFTEVARQLGLQQARYKWSDPEYVATELSKFMALHVPPDRQHRMPTHSFLVSKGCSGLRYALKLHGTDVIARRLNLLVQSRGRKPVQKRKPTCC